VHAISFGRTLFTELPLLAGFQLKATLLMLAAAPYDRVFWKWLPVFTVLAGV